MLIPCFIILINVKKCCYFNVVASTYLCPTSISLNKTCETLLPIIYI